MNTDIHPNITIVVLNWNGIVDTLACLDSLATLTYLNFNVVVVDNGSTDHSLSKLRAYSSPYPLVLLETGQNLGYAGGNNVGTRWALENNADYVFILNNDAVVGPDTLTKLIETAEAYPDGAFFSPKIYYLSVPQMLWYAGGRWNMDWMDFEHIRQKSIDLEENESAVPTDYASGCAMLVRTDAIRKIGLMDDMFFLTYEESDWCYRGRKAGWESYVVNGAKAWHKVSASFGGAESPLQQYFYTRNLLLFGERHLGWRDFSKLLIKSLRRVFKIRPPEIGSSLLSRVKHSYWNLITIVKRSLKPMDAASHANNLALRDYFLRRFGDCPDKIRQLNQSSKK